MVRTPGFVVPSSYSSQEELEADVKRRAEEAGDTPFDPSDFLAHSDKPPLDDNILIHYGVKGMRWGQRKNTDHPGASRATNKEARKDAQEFARAKLFYGEGAGTRRKLIKASVEAKTKRDPTYKAAFDHHLAQQDLSVHAQKARGERKRKDTKAKVGKNVRAANRAINGPFASGAAVALAVSAYGGLKATGLDKKVMQAGRNFMNQQKYGAKVDLSFLNNR
jgi:hypothetical protein